MRNRCILLAVLLTMICASLASAQITPVPAAVSSESEPRIITLQFSSMPIPQALDTLLKGTGRNYRLEKGTRLDGTVTVSLQDVPLDNAVQIVLRSAGLLAAREGSIYTIKPMPMVAVQQAAPQPQQFLVLPQSSPIGTVDVKPSTSRAGGQRFDILLDKANVLESMKQIMEVARRNYVIDTGLDSAWAGPLGPRISSRMRGIALDEAIQALGKSANLVVILVGGTYTVRPPDGAMPFVYVGSGSGAKTAASKSSVAYTTGPDSLAHCAKCSGVLLPMWRYCPQCGTQVPAPAGK